LALAVAAVAVGSAACQPAPTTRPAASVGSSESTQLLSMVNDYRAANGVPGLAAAGDATAKAQQHAQDMAAAGTIFHSSDLAAGIQPGWSAIGENVGVGYSLSNIEAMLEASSPHRANLLNGAYDQAGMGVAHGADGRIYVTQVFVAR
jgi:uncharacterized protein YkwD